MNLQTEDRGNSLHVSGLDRLSSTNARLFKELVLARLAAAHQNVEVDMSHTSFIDSVGLGALLAVLKQLTPRQGRLCLLQPMPAVRGMLTLLRLERAFDIIPA